MTATSRKITLQTLADLAGVSRATASRALNNSPLVNNETRQRIQSLAKTHNYTINDKARALRLGKSQSILVVLMVDEASGQRMSDPFFLSMLGGIADALAQVGYDLTLYHEAIHNAEEFSQTRTFAQADGVIIVGQGELHEELNTLTKTNKPIAVWGSPVCDKRYSVVGTDNFTGGQLATEYLLKKGKRRIAFFGSTSNPENAARYEGYCAALAQQQIDASKQLKLAVPFEMDKARQVILDAMQGAPEIDGACCATDVIALAAIATFNDLGLVVPGDIAVIGYDDIPLAAYSNPALTTIRQDPTKASTHLVTLVIDQLEQRATSDITLTPELVIRKSV